MPPLDLPELLAPIRRNIGVRGRDGRPARVIGLKILIESHSLVSTREEHRWRNFVATLLIALSLSRLVTPAVAQFDPLLRVAPIEAERDHPTSTFDLPPFPPEPHTRRFILMRYLHPIGGPPKAVYLRIPERYLGADTSEPTRAFGVALLVKYPEMTGPHDPENVGKLLECSGPCPGIMLVSIYNKINVTAYGADSSWQALRIHMNDLARRGLSWFSEEKSVLFSVRINEVVDGNKNNASNAAYFIQKKSTGEADFFSKCSVNTVVHGCATDISSERFRGLEIKYDTRLESIDEWPSIRKSVTDLVDSFVINIFDVPDQTQ